MTDVAQILGAAPPTQIPASHQPGKSNKGHMSRDVLDVLVGKHQEERTAELPPSVPTVKVGNRWIQTKKPAKPWAWAPFTSSARTDGLVLHHWVRANVEYPDYPFSRFDIHLDPVVYTDDEYETYLKSDEWTKAETDLLLELSRRYELRWPVIHDRWLEAFDDAESKDSPPPHHRIEDLQYRYYSVAALLTQGQISHEAAIEAKALEEAARTNTATPSDQLLLETAAARALASSDPQHQPLIANVGTGTSNKVFDLNRERERRQQMELLWNKTKQEEMEEASLRKELGQIELQLRKLKKRGAHILAANGGGLLSSAASSRNPSRSATPVPGMDNPASLDQAFATAAPTPTPNHPYLQSGRLEPPSTGGPTGLNRTLLTRMETVLEEMNVPERPLPTKRVCDLYDAVRKDALTLFILQKNILQKEGLVQSRRLKLAKMGGNVRVVDEETLMGIAPPPAPPAVRTNSKTAASVARGGSKGSAVPKTASGGKGKGGSASKKGEAAAAAGGAAGEKKPRKPSVKRTRKSETSKNPVPAAAPSAAKSAPVSTAASTEPKTAGKKRVRKS